MSEVLDMSIENERHETELVEQQDSIDDEDQPDWGVIEKG